MSKVKIKNKKLWNLLSEMRMEAIPTLRARPAAMVEALGFRMAAVSLRTNAKADYILEGDRCSGHHPNATREEEC